MAINMSLAKTQSKPKFSVALQSEKYQQLLNNTLKDPKVRNRFIADICTVVSNNPALQECETGSIVASGLQAHSLGLSMIPQLGYCYSVPYKDNKNNRIVAQFMVGWRGFVQLAIQTSLYKKINVIAIKEGELQYFDPLNEEIKVKMMIDDWNKREKAKTTGYYAFFELVNGFKKAIYWSIEEMENHAITYSKGYQAKKGYTFWEKNFDEMAKKTMLRQLIGKWGPMSIEMQEAFTKDAASLDIDGKVDYVDNQPDVVQPQELSNNEPVAVEEPVQETASQEDDNQEIEKFEGDL